MIHYALRCATGHDFDGWFPGSAAFDSQARAGLLECPLCGSTQVARAMMAPGVVSGASAPASAPPQVPASADRPVTEMAMNVPPVLPDQMRAMLQRLRAEVERKCAYVGPNFAEAARAMHNGAQPARPIYGETTPDQAEALAEDGIEVSSIPWVPRADG